MGSEIMEREPIKVGLARVSTDDQTCDLQINALKAYGCDKIFCEHGVSGGIHPKDRQEFRQAREMLQENDILAVWKMDRLGRNLFGILETIQDLSQNGIHFISLTENFSTDTPAGRAMMQMIGVMAQLERELIRERTIEGLQAAKRRGQKLGRPFALDDVQIRDAYEAVTAGQSTIDRVASGLGVSCLTLQRGFRRLELLYKAGEKQV